MQHVHIDESNKATLRSFTRNNYEVNGQISVVDGEVDRITHRKGQVMQPCVTGCLLNFHTHPADYTTLYPDHPSSTDYKYIHTATCKFSELSAHVICTPMFIYVVYYKCRNPIFQFFDFFTMSSRIQSSFDRLASTYDRSTEDFRLAYAREMVELGFHVQRFRWEEDVRFEIPKFKSGLFKKITIIFIVALSVFFIKKYM